MKRSLGPFSIGRLVAFAIVGGLVIAGIAFIPSLFCSDCKSFEVTDASVRLELADDASLLVEEDLTFDFSGGVFEGANRDILLRMGERITEVEVRSEGRSYEPGGDPALFSSDRPGTFGTSSFRSEGGKTFRIVWHYLPTEDDTAFTLRYRVAGVATAYDDVIDVPWAIWGDQWDFTLDELHAEFVAPGAVTAGEEVEAWVRPRSVRPELGTSPGTLTFESERIPEFQAVGLRMTVPRSAVASAGGAKVVDGPGLANIEAEEAAIDSAQGGIWADFKGFVFENVVLAFAIWTAIVLGLLALILLRARERPTSVPRHLAEPPEDVPPALAYALATEGGYDDRLVLATLLDLADRGYFEAKALTASESLDLELSVPAERPPAGELQDYEVIAVDFFDKLIGQGRVALSKLADKIPEHSSAWRTRWTGLTGSLDKAEEGKLGWDRDMRPWRAGLAVLAAAGYLVLTIAYFSRTDLLLIPVAATIIGLALVLSVTGTALRRLDAAGRERSAGWQSFARWTEDFPSLDDDPPATLKLWRRIMVYAVAFGTAERIAESGRIPAPVSEEAGQSADWTAYAFVGGMHSPSFNAAAFAGGFASQVAPAASSGSGGGFGGGFSSGGGGGFSGGGGGGAW